jgi:SAM-dependent methyltransferase
MSRRILPDLTTHRCASCGLIVSAIERLGPAFPEFALVEQEAYVRSVGASRTRQAAHILEHLTRHVSPGASILDIGCSFGFFLQEARRAGFGVRGVEPDPQAHAHATSVLGKGVVHLGTLDEDSARPRSADVVATLDVIEHIPPEEHETFAERVRSILEPGGIWIIKVPSTEGLYYKLSDLMVRAYPPMGATLVRRMWQTRYEYPHLVYFSLGSLSAWLKRFGFDVISHRFLPEIPTATIVDRLTTDGDIGKAKAYLAAPAIISVTLIDRLRGRSDALVVFARPRK